MQKPFRLLSLRQPSDENTRRLQEWVDLVVARIAEFDEQRDQFLKQHPEYQALNEEILHFVEHYDYPAVLVRQAPDDSRPVACSRVTLHDTVELFVRAGGRLETLHPLSRLFSHKKLLSMSYPDDENLNEIPKDNNPEKETGNAGSKSSLRSPSF